MESLASPSLKEMLNSQRSVESSRGRPSWWGKLGLQSKSMIEANGFFCGKATPLDSFKDTITSSDFHSSLAYDLHITCPRRGKSDGRFTLHLNDSRPTKAHQEVCLSLEQTSLASDRLCIGNLSYLALQHANANGFSRRIDVSYERHGDGSGPGSFLSDQPDILPLDALIEGHSKHGHSEDVVRHYIRPWDLGVSSDIHVLVAIMKSCTEMATLYLVHAHIVEAAFESDALVSCSIMGALIEFNDFDGAHTVFNKFGRASIVMWNALISGYVQHEKYEDAFMIFKKMQDDKVQPNPVTYTSILKACARFTDQDHGRWIHACTIEANLESDMDVRNTLVDMYAKCGSFGDAQCVFDRSPKRDTVTWNALLSGFTRDENAGMKSLQLYGHMVADNIKPDRVTFISMLGACSGSIALDSGRKMHAHILAGGMENGVFVGNTIIAMYARCESLVDAHTTFKRLPTQDVVTWSVLLAGHVHNGHNDMVYELFKKMRIIGINPNQTIYACILKAISCSASLEHGRDIHSQVVAQGFASDSFLSVSLIDMYANCGRLHDAQFVFMKMPKQDVVAWTSLISGFTLHGHGREAFLLLEHMRQAGVEGNLVTYLSLLKASANIRDLEEGKRIHALMMEKGGEVDEASGTTLIDMYGKCGSVEDARRVFDKMLSRDVMAWSALISGHAEHGHSLEALKLFKQMGQEGVKPSPVTFLCLLKACSSMGAVRQIRLTHAQIIEHGYARDTTLGNALIHAYAMSGSLERAHTVFHSLPSPNVMAWSSLMKGHTQECDAQWVFQSFQSMREAGLEPDEVLFVCVLSTCSRVGLLDEGCSYFKSMLEEHGIAPALEHYNSMVDLLGYVGCLAEAEDLLETLACARNVVGWTSLLNSCKVSEKVTLGQRCFDHMMRVEPEDGASYTIMSNLYTRVGLHAEAERLEAMRKSVEAWKKPARAFIEVNDEVHSFTVGDETHPQSGKIYAKLDALHEAIEKRGYQAGVSYSSAQEKYKRDSLCGHSERLAIAFGLLSTLQGTTIRVTKNLRMCVSCHENTEVISELEVRQIVVVDTYCIHKFEDGVCSCKCKF